MKIGQTKKTKKTIMQKTPLILLAAVIVAGVYLAFHFKANLQEQIVEAIRKTQQVKWLSTSPTSSSKDQQDIELCKRWPQITFGRSYASREFIDPDDPCALGMEKNPETINDMTAADEEERFVQLVSAIHVHCTEMRRMGKATDGGWDICEAGPYKPRNECIVYSFGIKNDYSFDDAMGKTYHCQVKSYDPSTKTETHQRSQYVYFYKIGIGADDTVNQKNWKIMSFESIIDRNNHTNKIIDYLKMDIESNEWATLAATLKRGTLRKVKQFSLEIHTGKNPQRFVYFEFYKILLALEQQGFRRYHYHNNRVCTFKSRFTGKSRTSCHELYYININYL